MKKVARLLGGFATLAIMLGATSGPAHAAPEPAGAQAAPVAVAVPGIAPPGSERTAVYLDRVGRVIATPAGGSAARDAALIGCTPVSGRDNPHYSGGDVSGHGWWGKGNCSNDRAWVTNCLYEWYTDNSWRQKACSERENLKPGTGGSTWRTNARTPCGDRTMTSWRNHVDVDVIGEVDSGEWPHNQANVACRVY